MNLLICGITFGIIFKNKILVLFPYFCVFQTVVLTMAISAAIFHNSKVSASPVKFYVTYGLLANAIIVFWVMLLHPFGFEKLFRYVSRNQVRFRRETGWCGWVLCGGRTKKTWGEETIEDNGGGAGRRKRRLKKTCLKVMEERNWDDGVNERVNEVRSRREGNIGKNFMAD